MIERKQGEPADAGTELGLLDEEELERRLLAVFEAPGYQPPRLPAVAMEILSLSRQAEIEFGDVEATLEKDPLLAGEVLGLARSAVYSRAAPPAGLRDALVRLGLDKVSELVLQAALNVRVFRSEHYGRPLERLRRHSAAVAHLSKIVSDYTPVAGEQAFLCGLLHDIGIAGILLALGESGQGQAVPDLVAVWPAIVAVHERVGARLIELWQLPAETAIVVAAHHQVAAEGTGNPLAAVVCLGDELAVSLGLGLGLGHASEAEDEAEEPEAAGLERQVDRSDAAVVSRACAALALSDESFAAIVDDARVWAEKTASLL